MTSALTRPRILARAAKAGAALYRRDRDLSRLIPRLGLTKAAKARIYREIFAAEAKCEADRKAGDATYSFERHISLLAALIAEGRAKATS